MKLRKLTAIILTLVMAMSLLSAFALADGDPTFRGDNIEAKAGETITYNVYIENNPGIAGYMVQVDFSPEAFDLDSASATDEFQNPIEVGLGDFSKGQGNVVGNPTKYGCVVLYFNVNNVKSDGIIFDVTLKVKDDAVNGTHAVKIRYDDRNTVYVDDATGATQYASDFKTVDGSVTVTGGTEGIIDNDAVGPTPEELEEMENDKKLITNLDPNDEPPTTEYPSETNPTPPVETPANEQTTGSVGGNSENATGNTDTTGTTGGSGESGENTSNGNDDGAVNNTQLTNDGTETGEAPGTVTHNAGTAGNNVTKIILIAVAAVVVIAVILFFVLKAMTGKKSDNSADGDDKDLDINEVLGWNKPEDDFNDGDDDDDDDVDD